MEAVYSLINLPKPLDPEQGRTQLASACSFTKSRKRKRFEVCAAVDGESISIYNIQTPSLISSHAVSPRTRFLCPPCCVLVKSNSEKSEIRKTYVVTQDENNDAPSVLLFEDKKLGNEPSAPRKLHKNVSNGGQILAIEPIRTSVSVNASATAFELLLVRKNGSLECLSSDLEDPLWDATLGNTDIESVSFVDGKAFADGLLKHREDIVGQLTALAGNDEKRLETLTIICTIKRTEEAQSLQITFTALRPRNHVMLGFEQPIQELVMFQTPSTPILQQTEQALKYSWNFKSGFLHVKSSNTILTYDFLTSTPKIISSVHEASPVLLDQTAGPGSFIISISETSLSLYDSRYSSIQDRQSLSPAVLGGSKKRKRVNDLRITRSASFVDYFSKLGLAVIFHGHELVAVQLKADSRLKRRRGDASTILASLGKGVGIDDHSLRIQRPLSRNSDALTMDQTDSSWPDTRMRLFKLVEDGNSDEFDRQFASEVGLEALDPSSAEETFVSWRWKLDTLKQGPFMYRTKALFALRAIFKLGNPDTTKEEAPRIGEDSNLRVRFLSPNVFHWLVVTGQLSTSLVEQAFRQFPEGDASLFVQKPNLVKSIAEFDPSLEILCSVVEHHPHLHIDDLAQCIKYIVRSYDNSTLPAPKTLLQNGDENLPNGDIDNAIENEVESALKDLDMAITDLEESHPMRGEALSRALTQLNAYSTLAISEALRHALSQHEIVFLIHILRIELAEGGWTARYVDSTAANAESGGPFNHSITVVSRLISCAVDAVGIAGWLTTTAIDPVDSVDELLASLRAEISAALEGTHEATYMNGLLNEFLLYSNRYRDVQKVFSGKNISAVKSVAKELPLGLRVEDQISRYRIGAGGQIRERSKRDIKKQLSMKVPAYSFERIRV